MTLGATERRYRRIGRERVSETGGRWALDVSPASALAHQRADVGERAELPQLVGVDHRSDHLYGAVGDVHAEDVDQPSAAVEDQSAGWPLTSVSWISTFS